MLKQLFSSEVRVLLLKQFLMNPGVEFYLRELSNKFNVSPRQISIELKKLESIELIQKRIVGKQHYYSVNTQHPIFIELQNIFIKTIGIKEIIRKHLVRIKQSIDFGFIYGSLAKGNMAAKSDIDLMLIGKISSRTVSTLMLKAGLEVNREINYQIFSMEEFKDRLINKDHFISSVFKEAKIFIIGNPNEFERLGKEWLN
jgi:predicted nucleotidyltransferase